MLLTTLGARAQTSTAIAAQAPSAPLTVTLKDALQRARANSVDYQTAITEAGIRHDDKVIARAALLPSVSYRSQYLYTQPASIGAPAQLGVLDGTPRFIANNAVHEYVAQGIAHEDLSAAGFAAYHHAAALEAVARAQAEIGTRGLVVSVVDAFYSLAAAQQKLANAQRALDEANRFLDISRKLENGGEVAHADIIKAQLQANDRMRDTIEARLSASQARLNLAVLLFKDFNQNFTVADDLSAPENLPSHDEVVAAAQKNNPELAAAFHALRAADLDVFSAKAEYLPSLSFDYDYGIDATHFALHTDGARNLGYSAAAQLNLPVWNWFATGAKVHQASLQRNLAQVQLDAAQKKLLSDLQSKYDEATAAQRELDILRQSAQLAADSLHLTNLRYRGGEATVLEVVDAQNTLTAAQSALSDGELRFRVALAVLQTLTGEFNP